MFYTIFLYNNERNFFLTLSAILVINENLGKGVCRRLCLSSS